MKLKIIRDIINFAFFQTKHSQKIVYIFKGIIFLPFLVKMFNTSITDKTSSTASNILDDIYPLF